jgi:hypothetical protein
VGIYENQKYSPMLKEPALIGQPTVAAAGLPAATAVAVLDTGVDYTRSA